MSLGATFSPGTTRIVAAGLPFLMVHDCPRVTKIVNGSWHFGGTQISESCTMCTTLTATFRSKCGRRRFASARLRVLGRMCGLITKNFALPRTQSKRFEIMQPDSQGLLIVYENLWSPLFAVAAREAGGRPVASGHIPTQAIVPLMLSTKFQRWWRRRRTQGGRGGRRRRPADRLVGQSHGVLQAFNIAYSLRRNELAAETIRC